MPLLQNRVVKFILLGIGTLFALAIVFVVMANVFVSGLGMYDGGEMNSSFAPSGPGFGVAYDSDGSTFSNVASDEVGRSSQGTTIAPEPRPDGFISGLELYETTNYNVSAKTKQFDEMCGAISNLKTNPDIHFKYLNSSTNQCQSQFFVEDGLADSVLETLKAFPGVEVIRNTESVTRHRQQLESRTAIVQDQLASVERSLTMAENQFDEIAAFARVNNDAEALSEAIRFKLQNIDSLTQRKINLNAQLDNLYQQAADLEERLGVIQFDVRISRTNPVYPNRTADKWSQAFEELKEQFTNTLIGLTTVFGIFLLWAIRLSVYLLVVILLARGLWKFAQLVWRRW